MQQGRFADLERAVQEVLAAQPANAVGWKLLALALSRQGKDAMPALLKSAALLPDDAEAHCNLGNALRRQGRLAEAIASHSRALAIAPKYAEAHNNLGAALFEAGQVKEAIVSYRRAIELKPDFALAIMNLGRAHLESGNAAEATLNLRRATDLDATLAAAHAGLASALMQQGLPQEALQACRKTLELEPRSASAHWHLANVLAELGRPADAVPYYLAAVELKPDFAMAHSNLGCAFRDLGQTESAALSFQRAIELIPADPEVHNNLSIVLRLLHRHEEAAASAARAHALSPDLAAPLVSLAGLQADQGEFMAAEALLRQAQAADPDSAEACSKLVGLRRMTPSDTQWLADARRIGSRRLPMRQQAHLHFAMGKYFDDIADFPQAFSHYQDANNLKKKYSTPYDAQWRHDHISRLTELFMKVDGHAGEASARPVFVVGMPRAGTSLAEQILASHPLIHGAGELGFWGRAQAGWPTGGPRRAGEDELLSSLAAEYLELIEAGAAGAVRSVDKMPENFLNLGLIHAALPNARIIHMQRHPLDTCLSIYFQDFEATYDYANDLEDLAHCYAEYVRMMQHWRALLPAGSLLEVAYEDLVADPEVWSRRMIEFLNLSWNPACLDFHTTRRTVITASKWQIRQKISTHSVERWRNYLPHLGPLLRLMPAPVTRS